MPSKFPTNPLKRPFPDREFDRGLVLGHLRTAIFIFAALYILKPFGMDFGPNALAICLGYGLVTFIVAVAYSYVTDRFLGWQRTGSRWTLGKWILDCAAVLLLISLANFVYYNLIVGWGAFSWLVLTAIAVPTVLIGLFPIAISGVFIQMQAERNHQRSAGNLARFAGFSPPAPTRSAFIDGIGISETGSRMVALTDDFTIDPSHVLFCESRQNYVRIVYLDEGVAGETTIRATLAATEDKLSASSVQRCHRSFLVNTQHIKAARGNAQGLRLNMVGTDEEVPVSRSFVSGLRENM